MTLRRNIKRQARQALDGSWGQARLILIILLALMVCINILDASVLSMMGYSFQFYSMGSFYYSSNFFYNPIALLFSAAVWIIRLIVLAPLGIGMLGWYLDLTDRRRQGVSNIFQPYEDRTWLRAVWLQICIAVRVVLFSCLVMLLPTGFLLVSFYAAVPPTVALGFSIAGGVLLFFAGVMAVVFAKRYALAPMLLTQRHAMTVRQAIRRSVHCTGGRCAELLYLDLSFLPWLLPSMVLLGLLLVSGRNPFSVTPILLGGALILTLIVTFFKLQPYYTMTVLMYARYLHEYADWKEQQSPPERQEDAVERPQAPASPHVAWEPVEREPSPEPPQSDFPVTPPGDKVVWSDIPD